MNLTRTRSLLLAIAALAAAFAIACSGDDDGGSSTPTFGEPTAISGLTPVTSFPLDIPRSDGQTLTLEAAPVRIVSLSPAATEILYALGADGSLVAVDNNANYPTEVASLSARFDAAAPDANAIAAIDPDLVIVEADNGGIVARLDALNIPVFYRDTAKDITSVDSVLAQITLLGIVTGKAAEAEALNAGLGARVQAVRDAVQGVNSATSPKVFHELSADLRTVSTNTFAGDMYTIMRARNIAGDGGGTASPQLTSSAVVAAGPNVIILAHAEPGFTADSVKARAGWDTIPAVAEDRIASIDPDIITRPGPRIVDALEQVARAVYPERFQ